MDAFGPVLLKNKAAIEAIPRKTFKYGSTDRHQVRTVSFRAHSQSLLILKL